MPFSMMVVATMIGCNPMWQRLQPYVEGAVTLWVRAVLHDGGGHHDVIRTDGAVNRGSTEPR